MNELMSGNSTSLPSRHVLFPVYEIRYSRKAFRWFAENIATLGDRLFFIRIMPSHVHLPSMQHDESYFIDQTDNTYGLVKTNDPVLRSKLLDCAQNLHESFDADVKNLSQRFQNTIHQIALVKAQGHVGKAILEAQEYFRIDLIVMAPRDRSNFRRMFANRTADYVCHNTNIPVVFIPSNNLKLTTFTEDNESEEVVENCSGTRQSSCGLFKF